MRAPLTLALLLFPLALIGCPDQAANAPGDAPSKKGPEVMEMSAHANPSPDEFEEKIPAIPEGARNLTVTVGDRGYEPNTLDAEPAETVVLAFTRTSKSECGRYVQVMGTDTLAELPLNETVKIPVEMPESGTVTFACGMNMMRGIINVVPVAALPADTPSTETPVEAPDAPSEKKAG